MFVIQCNYMELITTNVLCISQVITLYNYPLVHAQLNINVKMLQQLQHNYKLSVLALLINVLVKLKQHLPLHLFLLLNYV